MKSNPATWATISGVVAIITAWFALTQFVIAPLERRIDVARDNLRQAIAERDGRMDYLQKQIDEVERKAEQK